MLRTGRFACFAFALVLGAPLLAGCLAEPASVATAADGAAAPPREAYERLAALAADLPCEADVGVGEGAPTSANLGVVRTALVDAEGGVEHAEMDLWESPDGAVARAAFARHATGGFDLVDLRDPASPTPIGFWDPDEPDVGLDVKFLPDGQTVVTGGRHAIHLVDVRAPDAPVLESAWPLAGPEAHMLVVWAQDGATYVGAAVAENEDLILFEVIGGPGERTLVEVSRPDTTLLSDITNSVTFNAHDASWSHDPLLDKPVLWVANAWEGLVALDVSDPAAPRQIARIPNTDPYQGYVHTVRALVTDDGRRLVFSMMEVGVNTLRVHDATDLALPRLLATWHTPEAVKPQHNLELADGYLTMAHYGEGAYVFDLARLPNGPAPLRWEPVAHLEGVGTGNPAEAPDALFRGTWDVMMHHGLLVTSDMQAGTRVVAFGCLAPGLDAPSSFR